MTFDQLDLPIQRCLERIDWFLRKEIPESSVEILSYRKGERISLALLHGETPVAMNFVSEDECRDAYAKDPHSCATMDRFTQCWIEVAKIKLADKHSLGDLNHNSRIALNRSTPVPHSQASAYRSSTAAFS